jgi:hypothetical protein
MQPDQLLAEIGGALPPYKAMADCGRMKRTELIRALVEPELQAQLRRAAQEQDRSLSWTVHEILAEWAQQQRQQGQKAAEARRGG